MSDIMLDLQFIDDKYPETLQENKIHLESLPLSIHYHTQKQKSGFLQLTNDIKDRISYYQTFQALKDVQFTGMLTGSTRDVIAEYLGQFLEKIP